jgi:septum formation protein
MRLILASSSPRRIQMLRDLGAPLDVIKPDVAEVRLRGEGPRAYVKRLACEKAAAVQMREGLGEGAAPWCILAADTTVVMGSKLLEKPKDEADARRMLSALNGKTHEVLTGFCWLGRKGHRIVMASKVVSTKVTFAKRPSSFWRWYVQTGEPMDKAGAYAAQGIGLSFVQGYKGSYANVVGMPLPEVLESFEGTFGSGAFKEAFPCFR